MPNKNRERTLMFDSLLRPIVHEGQRTVIQDIIHLCSMQPGDDPENPEKGIDMASYRGSTISESEAFEYESELEAKLYEQNEKYLKHMVSMFKCEIVGSNNNVLRILVVLQNPETTYQIAAENFEVTGLDMIKD